MDHISPTSAVSQSGLVSVFSFYVTSRGKFGPPGTCLALRDICFGFILGLDLSMVAS